MLTKNELKALWREHDFRPLKRLGQNFLVDKNIKDKYSRVEVFEEDDYYQAMNECFMGIINAGLTLFQCLYWGMPVISLPTWNHQKDNISKIC